MMSEMIVMASLNASLRWQRIPKVHFLKTMSKVLIEEQLIEEQNQFTPFKTSLLLVIRDMSMELSISETSLSKILYVCKLML